ncbi:MAG: 16S rRNA (guanine(527)-N(7))-methyltransferase RsmG [Gammaproteobacteria bacterium]|nr:16S rRNA (guanine(527)-N(7))-methyltransferase RsmG [Gammaproteobacteria bacterium]
MQIGASPQQIEQLTDYLKLLQKWNRSYNLTAIDEPAKMVSYHVLDSLSIMSAIDQQARCLDVGSGAGLPGIPLATLLPQSRWVLLDSNGKKTRFIQQAVATLGLENVSVVHSRVQDYHAEQGFDVIVSRAYASLQDFVQSVQHLWQPHTRLLTMKTELDASEQQQLETSLYQLQVTPLKVPGIAEKRSLVIIERKDHD